MKYFLLITHLILVVCLSTKGQQPNIIVFLADDAGFSDYQPYNTMFDIDDDVRIKTPNIEKLSKQGMTFTNAHTTGGVCQPSRYSIMTGMYSFRKPITGNPCVEGKETFIENWRFTIADMFKENGYETGMVGKWHLDYSFRSNEDPEKKAGMNNFDHTLPAILTPNDYGFDYVTWTPKGVGGAKFFVENRNVVKLAGTIPYHELHPDKPNWKGHERWVFETYNSSENMQEFPGDKREILGDVFTDKALEFMESSVKNDKPFYLYFAHTAPHAPHLPCEDINGIPMSENALHFNGTEAERNRQKLVYENDVIVGQIMEQLKRLGIAENTILIFTSDNGPGKPGAKKDGATAIYNGHKGTAYEGGNRVPFIVKWPGKIKPGSKTDDLVSQVDLFNTFADIIGAKSFPEYAAQDSKSMLPLLMHKEKKYERQWSFSTKHKVEPYTGYLDATCNLGVLNIKNHKLLAYYNPDTNKYEPIAFFDLNNDPGEKHNLVNNKEYKNHVNAMMDKVREEKNKKITP